MKIRILLYFISIFVLIGCKSQQLNKKIEGVWIFESKFNSLFIDDEDRLGGFTYPVIYDFQKNKKLIFKHYGYKDFIHQWALTNDSILTLDSLNYKVITLNDKTLTLLDQNNLDSHILFLHKPKEVRLDNSPEEISKILVENNWFLNDSINKNSDASFEFVDNGKMIYRYKIFDRSLKDTTYNIQIENWKIIEYKGYKLIAHIKEPNNDAYFNQINQILTIDSLSHTLLSSYRGIPSINSFSKKNFVNKKKKIEKLLIGKWIGYNSKEKTYGNYADNNSKRTALYEGNLTIEFNNSDMLIKLDSLNPYKYKWFVTKDGNTLIQENHIEDDLEKGSFFSAIDLLQVSKDSIKARFFNNYYFTSSRFDIPNLYYINLIQDLKRID